MTSNDNFSNGLLRTEISDYKKKIDSFYNSLPDRRNISAPLSSKFQDEINAISKKKIILDTQFDNIFALLTDKMQHPNEQIDFLEGNDLFDIDPLLRNFQSVIVSLNRIISEHNEHQDRFIEEKSNSIRRLKFSILLENVGTYSELQNLRDQAENALNLWIRLQSRAKSRLNEVQKSVRSHGPAVDEINRLLSVYLGHEEITLVTLNTGYEIYRAGRKIIGPMSEGERTALAICYFICKIKENGRSADDLIIVVDDPVSSLDSNSLHYAHGMLRDELKNAGQLFIMTHNLEFLNEARRWMRRENEIAKKGRSDPPCAFINILQRVDSKGDRSSILVLMPKLLRAYGSEYHYLFSIVHDFVKQEGKIDDVVDYMVPHIIRRLLELFFSFRLPDSRGFDEKLLDRSIRDLGIAGEDLSAISRLSHTGSHSDNVDGISRLSPILIGESFKAAKATFRIMDKMDGSHYQKMCELCG